MLLHFLELKSTNSAKWAGIKVKSNNNKKSACFNYVLTSEVLREISTHIDRPTAGSCPAKAFFASWVTSGISLMAKLNCRMKEKVHFLHFFEKLPTSTLQQIHGPTCNVLGLCSLKYLWNSEFPDWLRLFIFANISLTANSNVLYPAIKIVFPLSHLLHMFTHRVGPWVSPVLIKPITIQIWIAELQACDRKELISPSPANPGKVP